MAPEEKPSFNGQSRNQHILIAGAGVVGLSLAQGCRQHGIPFTIFERNASRSDRSQGWALTLHWSLRSIRRLLGPELAKDLPKAAVDPSLKLDAGNFLFLNAETGEVRYKVPPVKERFRLDRAKLLELLSTGIDIQWGKHVTSYEDRPHGTIQVRFKDGTSMSGSMLVGADGNNSKVRKCLMGDEKSSLTTLPINLIGVIRHFTADEAEVPLSYDPLLFNGLQPQTSNYFWCSVQNVILESDGRKSLDSLVLISWLVKDPIEDAIPKTKRLCVAKMKERARGFAAPLRGLFEGIPDDLESVTSLTLADFPNPAWDSQAKVTLVGDAAHAMTMYRGEGANHGILDAALLIDELIKMKNGEIDQVAAISAYETEMKARAGQAVLKSRQAALDGHCWADINDDSPLIGGRYPPKTA